jgi:peptidoglycan/LPS O-acetylase OafA/YrhL
MTIQREWVTPITVGAFLLSAVTGVLMFFHSDVGLNKVAHEWLSWALLVGVVLHVFANFNSFQRHLVTHRGQLLIGLFALILLLSFIGPPGKGEPPFMQPIKALSAAPLTTLAQVAQLSPEQLRERLAKVGLQPSSNQQSLSDLIGPDMRKQVHILNTLFTEK